MKLARNSEMLKFWFVAYLSGVAILLGSFSAAAAEKTKVSILWRGFPDGTQCSAENVQGKLKVSSKRGNPKVDVNGFGDTADFFCILPDGRKIVTDANKNLPEGTRVAGITIAGNGEGHMTISAGDLIQTQFSNAFRWGD